MTEIFGQLEKEVASGSIGCYGVYSNRLHVPSDDPSGLKLEQLLNIASEVTPSAAHSFKAIKADVTVLSPSVLVGAYEERSVFDVAKENGMLVFGERPFDDELEGVPVRLQSFTDSDGKIYFHSFSCPCLSFISDYPFSLSTLLSLSLSHTHTHTPT